MKIAHLADLHLGFPPGADKLSSSVQRQRSRDVMAAFQTACDEVAKAQPDVIVIAGDIFHMPRPSNDIVLHAYEEFSALAKATPGALRVMVAGNHDQGNAADTGCLLPLLKFCGFEVAAREPRYFTKDGVTVHAVPEGKKPGLKPSGGVNVLLYHGEVNLMPARQAKHPAHMAGFAEWDYVALGHYHQRTDGPNGGYSGSLEHVSSDPWHEDASRLGWVLWDTDARTRTFFQSKARPHVDLPVIEATGLPIDRLRAMLAEHCEGIPDGAVVRQRILGLYKEDHKDIAADNRKRGERFLKYRVEKVTQQTVDGDVTYEEEARTVNGVDPYEEFYQDDSDFDRQARAYSHFLTGRNAAP